MTTDESTAVYVPDSRSLAAVSTGDLWDELSRAIGVTAKAIARLAMIWVELEKRGEDLSDVKFSLRSFLPMVATGRLLPEAVAALAGQTRKLRLLSDLSVHDQGRLLGGAPVEVFKPGGCEEKPFLDTTLSEAALVIRGGVIRTAAEQELAVKARDKVSSSAKKRALRRGRPHRISVDRENGMLRVGAVSAPLEDVLAALRISGVF